MKTNRLKAISRRKDEHIKLCMNYDVRFKKITTGFEEVKFECSMFPRYDPSEINLKTKILNKEIDFPVIISGMTGGSKIAKKINKIIAKACQDFNIAMGVGSQRSMIEHPELTDTYVVRDVAPDIPLFGNLGVAQIINGYTVKEANVAVSSIDADGLAIHVNPLQEFVQEEGDRRISEAKDKIVELIDAVSFPVMIKGVGTGVSVSDAKFLANSRAEIIDIAGAGGTNWTLIDAIRNKTLKYLSDDFIEWGISSFQSLKNMISERTNTKQKIVCSGGIWSGINAVKALIMGADYVAFALPVIKAIKKGGIEAVENLIYSYVTEMKIVMAILGKKNLKELQKNS